MFKYTVKYKNYEGVEVEKLLRFNLTKSEMIRLNREGNVIAQSFRTASLSKDPSDTVNAILDLVKISYGVLVDGDTFKKTDEIVENFIYSLAFEAFLNELTTKENLITTFFANVLGRDLLQIAMTVTPKERDKAIITDLMHDVDNYDKPEDNVVMFPTNPETV